MSDAVPVSVDGFNVADPAQAWARAGFAVSTGAACRIGDVRVARATPTWLADRSDRSSSVSVR